MKKKSNNQFVTRQDLRKELSMLSGRLDKRFEAMDKRFEALDIKLSLFMQNTNGRFEFHEERLLKKIDKKFHEWYNRYEVNDKHDRLAN